MKIEIKNYDTFKLIRDFLWFYQDNISAQAQKESEDILEQMKIVPSTDSEGNFVKDQRELCGVQWDEYARAAIPQFEEEIENNKDLANAVSNFWNDIGEAMGPICYSGFKLKEALDRAALPKDWVDDCIMYYEAHIMSFV